MFKMFMYSHRKVAGQLVVNLLQTKVLFLDFGLRLLTGTLIVKEELKQ